MDMDTHPGPVIYTIANSTCGPPGERRTEDGSTAWGSGVSLDTGKVSGKAAPLSLEAERIPVHKSYLAEHTNFATSLKGRTVTPLLVT